MLVGLPVGKQEYDIERSLVRHRQTHSVHTGGQCLSPFILILGTMEGNQQKHKLHMTRL